MSWVNALEEGWAAVYVDGHGLTREFYIPTQWTVGAQANLLDAIADVQIGSPLVRDTRIILNNDTPHTPDVSDLELTLRRVWRVWAVNGDTGAVESVDIPGADASLLPSGTEYAPLTTAPFDELVNRLELYWNNPSNSPNDAVMTVDRIRLVYI